MDLEINMDQLINTEYKYIPTTHRFSNRDIAGGHHEIYPSFHQHRHTDFTAGANAVSYRASTTTRTRYDLLYTQFLVLDQSSRATWRFVRMSIAVWLD